MVANQTQALKPLQCEPQINIENNEETCEIIIEFNDASKSQEDIIKKYGTIKHFFPMINSYVVQLPKKYIVELESLDNVASVFDNTHITAQMNNGRRAVCVDTVHSIGYDGRDVTIAFLDTGIASINDFSTPRNRILAFKDFVGGRKMAYDDNGHGTHV